MYNVLGIVKRGKLTVLKTPKENKAYGPNGSHEPNGLMNVFYWHQFWILNLMKISFACQVAIGN